MFRWFYKKQKIHEEDDFVIIDMHESDHTTDEVLPLMSISPEKNDEVKITIDPPIPSTPFIQSHCIQPHCIQPHCIQPHVIQPHVIHPHVIHPHVIHPDREMEQELQQFFNGIIVRVSSCIRELCYVS
jgi:hypothetical protein